MSEFPGAKGAPLPRLEDDELARDDQMPLLDKTVKHLTSRKSTSRVAAIKELREAYVQGGEKRTLKELVPAVLAVLLQDEEAQIRQLAAEHVVDLAIPLIQSGSGNAYNSSIGRLLPGVYNLMVDKNVDVRRAAIASCGEIAKFLLKSDLYTLLLPLIEQLIMDPDDEERRAAAPQLIQLTAGIFGIADSTSKFLPMLEDLASDGSYRVRKLPLFLKLSEDSIWSVRKECAESLVTITKFLPADKKASIVPILEKYAQDDSRWVRTAAFQHFGEFISLMASPQGMPALIGIYKGMGTEPPAKFPDSDLRLFCAYSFPGVLLTLGKESWTELGPVYMALANDLHWRVRKTLAHALHEVAGIIGPELTESNLLTVFDCFLHDLDEVKLGVIENICNFLQHLPEHTREQYSINLKELCEDPNWRIRQIGQMVRMYSNAAILAMLRDVTFKLISDPVASVRSRACPSIVDVIPLEPDKLSERKHIYNLLSPMASDKSFRTRQTFVMVSDSIVAKLPKDEFDEYFLDKLLPLANDRVPNVKLLVAAILFKLIQEGMHHYNFIITVIERYSSRMDILQALTTLKLDKDRDVSKLALGGR